MSARGLWLDSRLLDLLLLLLVDCILNLVLAVAQRDMTAVFSVLLVVIELRLLLLQFLNHHCLWGLLRDNLRLLLLLLSYNSVVQASRSKFCLLRPPVHSLRLISTVLSTSQVKLFLSRINLVVLYDSPDDFSDVVFLVHAFK